MTNGFRKDPMETFPNIHYHRWDQGLLDMCIGEKRTLTIPPHLAYGDRSMGPIAAGSTLGKKP